MRVLMVLLCPVVGLATLLTSCARPTGHASAPGTSSARPPASVQHLSQPQRAVVAGPVDPDLRVGPIFLNGATQHVCTGSVLHSAGGNLILTAAHCLSGATQIAVGLGRPSLVNVVNRTYCALATSAKVGATASV